MKTMKKVTFFLFGIFALSNLPTFCDEASDILVPTAVGAGLGGAFGGRRGAAIGASVGLFAGATTAASRRRGYNDRYYDNGYYYNKKYPRNKYYQSKPSYRNLRDENETLRQELEEMKRQPQE